MREPQPRAIHLKDYSPPEFRIDSLDLDVDLRDDHARVRAKLQVRRNGGPGPLVLDGEELQLISVSLDGKQPQYEVAAQKLFVYVEPGKLDQAGWAMDCLKRAIQWDEKRFGLRLDLDQYKIVAVGDFNSGAMENKGLNIFNTRYVLARSDVATDTDYLSIDRVESHEYLHNWTGHRVTCRSWFQLSLNEGRTVVRGQ